MCSGAGMSCEWKRLFVGVPEGQREIIETLC